MYTLTVKIAARKTDYLHPHEKSQDKVIDKNQNIINQYGQIFKKSNNQLIETGNTIDDKWNIVDGSGKYVDKIVFSDDDRSKFGHMWYSLSNDQAYGFSPVEDNTPIGKGSVKYYDDVMYKWTYYTVTIIIDAYKYNILKNWWRITPDSDMINTDKFKQTYNGLTNSCIDFTWKALEQIGIKNPGWKIEDIYTYEGNVIPTWNADTLYKTLYTYSFGDAQGWSEKEADKGNYHVTYGTKSNDEIDLTDKNLFVYLGRYKQEGKDIKNAVYSGNGNDIIKVNKELIGETCRDKGTLMIDGGSNYDTIKGTDGDDSIDLSKFTIQNVEVVELGDGNDSINVSSSNTVPFRYYGGTGNDSIDAKFASYNVMLYGDSSDNNTVEHINNIKHEDSIDSLYGSMYDDTLVGGKGNDILYGHIGFDTYIMKSGDGHDRIIDSDLSRLEYNDLLFSGYFVWNPDGHFAKNTYSSGSSCSVNFFGLSASPRLPVERVMGWSAAPFSGCIAPEPSLFASFPTSGRSSPL